MGISLITSGGHRPVVLGGNAKNLERRHEAIRTATAVLETSLPAGMRVLYAPSPTNMQSVGALLQISRVRPANLHLGAQDVAFHPAEGLLGKAVTGILSIDDAVEAGAEFAIVGHSDRRYYFGVPIEHAIGTANALLEKEITPVLCCGEFFGEQFDVTVQDQVGRFVTGIGANLAKVVIADEPVPHIKTNYNVRERGADAIQPLPAAEAIERARKIRQWIAAQFGGDLASRVVVLYGGSVDAPSLPGLLGTTNPAERVIDGGLIASAFVKGPAALINAARPFAID